MIFVLTDCYFQRNIVMINTSKNKSNCGRLRSLCSQISTRETWNVKHTRLSHQGKGCNTFYLSRRPGMDILINLLTLALSVWLMTFPALDPPPQTLNICLFFPIFMNLQTDSKSLCLICIYFILFL